MIIELTDQEVRLIKKLLKKELIHTKTEIKLVKIFELQNKLNFIDSSLQLPCKQKTDFEVWAISKGYTDVTFDKIKKGIEWFDYKTVFENYIQEKLSR